MSVSISVAMDSGRVIEAEIEWTKSKEELQAIINSELRKEDGVLRFSSVQGHNIILSTVKIEAVEFW